MLLAAILCLSALSVTPEAACEASPLPSDSVASVDPQWRLFRAAFPFHIQTVAISDPDSTGRRTLVISEPPPHVSTEGLALEMRELPQPEVAVHTIGFDGWVKDLVFQLPPMGADQLGVLVEKLSKYLYFTDYKSYAQPTAVDAAALSVRYPLDVSVRTTDIEEWFRSEQFSILGGEERVSLREAPPGVYVCAVPGLVGWVVPREGIEARKDDIRRFALDSDLILGAVSREDAVVVIGRERIAPVGVFPPIRVETVLDLAAATKTSLKQSYERNVFGAGSTSYARWDWAPIYLSPELIDTEFGSLLNLTDQILKGYSLCGRVEYHNFPHPAPSRFPFDAPLIEVLGANSLLFNWNTVGFGLCTRDENCSFYAPTCTGSLPVIYRTDEEADPSPAVLRAEDQAYTYFASLNDPLLARVVQYTTLYQVFCAFDVTAPARAFPQWNHGDALRCAAASAIEALRQASADEVARTVDAVIADGTVRARAAEVEIDCDREAMILQLAMAQSKCIERYMVSGSRGEESVGSLLGMARDSSPREYDHNTTLQALMLAWIELDRYFSVNIQREVSGSRLASTGWIRTPTVVFSRCLGRLARASGGHDLDYAVAKVIRSAQQRKGTVAIAEDGTISCNPADAPVVESMARRISRQGSHASGLKEFLEQSIRSATPRVKTTRAQQIARSAEHSADPRGFSKAHVPHAGSGGRNPPPGSPGACPPATPPDDSASAKVLFETVHIEKDGVCARLRRNQGNGLEECELWNRHDVVYALIESLRSGGRSVDKSPLRIRFGANFTDAEALQIMDDLSLQLNRHTDDRMVLCYRMLSDAGSLSNQQVRRAALADLTVATGAERRVSGAVEIATAAQSHFQMQFEVRLMEARPHTSADVRRSVQKSIDGVVERKLSVEDIPTEIYQGLIDELDAVRAGSGGSFKVSEIGSVYVVHTERSTLRAVDTEPAARGVGE